MLIFSSISKMPSVVPLLRLAPSKTRDMLLLPPTIDLPKQPIGNTDHPSLAIKVSSLLGMLNDMLDDLAVLIKLEDEQPTELFVVSTTTL